MDLDALRDSAETKKIKKNLEKDQKRIYKILSDRTGHTVVEISAECVKNQSMTSEEAMRFGLIDEVI